MCLEDTIIGEYLFENHLISKKMSVFKMSQEYNVRYTCATTATPLLKSSVKKKTNVILMGNIFL